MNNEMDDLFRKAGEDYPLNLGKPDWDAVAGKLHTDTSDLGPGFGPAAAAPRKRRRYQWLLLLLLPLGIYGVVQLTGGNSGSAIGVRPSSSGTRSAGPANAANPTDAPGSSRSAGSSHSERKTAKGAELRGVIPPAKDGGLPIAEHRVQSRKSHTRNKPAGKTATGSANSDLTEYPTGQNRSVRQKKYFTIRRKESPEFASKKKALKHSHLVSARAAGPGQQLARSQKTGKSNATASTLVSAAKEKKTTDSSSAATLASADEKAEPNAVQTVSTAGDGLTEDSTVAGNSVSNADSTGSDGSLADQVMAGLAAKTKDSSTAATAVKQKKEITIVKKSPVHPAVKQNRGFYAGLTAAPDFSTIKFQSMKSTGYSFGVVGGYRISSHFSIETGLGWDRKKYYSSGEYFDKSKTHIPSSVTVNYIDGYCDMFEIPLTVRYDLSSGKKGHWIAAAGFSSYLMKKENYLYGATTNNVNWSRYVDYKNSGSNFFAIAQFSLGYEYFLSARNAVRAEPYFKAPISGVGIGSLPITSVGITFGLIHSFR